MPKIFISYRRLDSQDFTDRLFDYMARHFGSENVFQDVGDSTKIPPGVDFVEYLAEQVRACDVVLVVIGEQWLRILQERAERDDDFVRIEVESALEQKKIVIPVLKSATQMPASSDLPPSIRALTRRNASRVRPNPDFARDCETLAQGIRAVFAMQSPITPPTPVGASHGSPTPATLKPTIPEHLQRARAFTGQRNRDWTPFLATFSKLKIPDMEFCLVPPGTFQMGSNDGYYDDEKPVHPQTFSAPFWIARYPVTNAQWRMGVQAGAVSEPQGENALKWYKDSAMADCPVVGVTWFESQKFAAWLGLRLPTEAEWEYAARGVEAWKYPWGNDWEDGKRVVWSQTSGAKPNPVTSKPEGASWVDALHFIGNVWEWTSSLYKPYEYVESDGREDINDRVTARVVRCGSWNLNNINVLRAACRLNGSPDYNCDLRGMRLARSY